MHLLTGSILCLRQQASGPVVWGALAMLSLGAALWIGTHPERGIDLALVRVWLDHWTQTGTSVYPVEALRVDYPPHALVLLLPLRWLPADAGLPFYLVINTAANVFMAWLLTTWMAHSTRAAPPPRATLAFALMILSWGAVRVGIWNGQTVAFAIIAGLGAVRYGGSLPWLSGAALAVAASKPTLGVGFGLVLLFRGHLTAIAAGAGLVLALTAAFDVSTGQVPLSSLADYAASLSRMYMGDSYVRGVTTMRKYFVDLSGGHWMANWAFAVYSSLMLAALFAAGWRVRNRPDAVALICAACLMWTLVGLPNQRYYLVLLAPVVWLLTWTPDRVAAPGARWPALVAAAWVIFNVIDGPVTLRYIAEWLGERTTFDWDWLWWASYAVPAPAILAVYVVLLRALWRLR